MKRLKLRTGTILMIGFLAIILVGAILLDLPISQRENVHVPFLDCLFVSVSAVCVTGLTPIDIAASLTTFGRIVLLLLIQVGGLGFATFAVFTLRLLRRNIGWSQRSLAKDALNMDGRNSALSIVRTVVTYAFAIEILGGVFLTFPYLPVCGNAFKAFAYGFFHSVSAFNNAGFDLNGNFSSMADFHDSVYVNLVLSLLIFLGALGFFVMEDLRSHRKKLSMISFHTKIVLLMSAVLVFGGMLLLMFCGMKPLDALFLSVSSRTAGFNTVPFEDLSNGAMLVVIVLMFIGANPGSTGGGVKTTTIFAIFLMMFSVASGRKPTAFKRRIPQDSILKAFAVSFYALVVAIVGVFGIMCVEGDGVPTLSIVFEVVSATATVGLSRSLTPLLHLGSKIILMIIMFIGRLGPLTIASFFTGEKKERLEYLEEHVLIG